MESDETKEASRWPEQPRAMPSCLVRFRIGKILRPDLHLDLHAGTFTTQDRLSQVAHPRRPRTDGASRLYAW